MEQIPSWSYNLGLSYAATCLYLYLISISIRSIIRLAQFSQFAQFSQGARFVILGILKMRLQQLFCCAMAIVQHEAKKNFG